MLFHVWSPQPALVLTRKRPCCQKIDQGFLPEFEHIFIEGLFSSEFLFIIFEVIGMGAVKAFSAAKPGSIFFIAKDIDMGFETAFQMV